MKIDSQIKEDLKVRLMEDLKTRKSQVTISSAYKISEEDINLIMKKFPHLGNCEIKYQVDRSLIAGYVIKMGSKVIDISLKGRLQNLKHLIYETDR